MISPFKALPLLVAILALGVSLVAYQAKNDKPAWCKNDAHKREVTAIKQCLSTEKCVVTSQDLNTLNDYQKFCGLVPAVPRRGDFE